MEGKKECQLERKRRLVQQPLDDVHFSLTDASQVRKLKEFDDLDMSVKSSANTVAEDSRPYRGFKKSSKKDPSEKRGRPKTTEDTDASRANWQQPALWNQILDACDHVGRPWEPTKIARYLQQINPRSFSGFSAQRISSWRDPRYPDRLVWKENVQRRVANGNRAQGSITSHGILVRLAKFDVRFSF